MIDFKMLEKLLDLLNSSDAQSIEVTKRWWSTSIRVSKSPGQPTSGPVTYQVANPPAPAVADEASPAEAPAPANNYVDVKSPMVGTFYTKPDPDSDAYVQPGGRIEKGKVVCIIEAMKIMNPLEAEVSGVVIERLVEDAQPVEFGQVLFRVDPNG
jgi:acetyl-CoA carboxylase biotin carboxyl carrier protein